MLGYGVTIQQVSDSSVSLSDYYQAQLVLLLEWNISCCMSSQSVHIEQVAIVLGIAKLSPTPSFSQIGLSFMLLTPTNPTHESILLRQIASILTQTKYLSLLELSPSLPSSIDMLSPVPALASAGVELGTAQPQLLFIFFPAFQLELG